MGQLGEPGGVHARLVPLDLEEQQHPESEHQAQDKRGEELVVGGGGGVGLGGVGRGCKLRGQSMYRSRSPKLPPFSNCSRRTHIIRFMNLS